MNPADRLWSKTRVAEGPNDAAAPSGARYGLAISAEAGFLET